MRIRSLLFIFFIVQSLNASLYVNVGGSSSSVNGGFSMSNGVSQSKQTVLSSITGDKVNVNVGNNTHLKGSLLASGNFTEDGKFIDNNNLNLTTNTLTFGNLSNSNYSSNKSLGASANFNLGSKNDKNQDVQKGVSSVGYQAENSLSVNASKTLATLGTGNVTVKDIENSDELDRLNRDTENINKDLYSSKTGTKVDATLDTRLLTEEGREQIAKEVEQLADTVKIIGSYISNYNKILEIQENAQNVNLKITQELDKLREENPQLYKDTLIAIQEYNNALKEQQDINGQLAFAPVAIVIPPLVTELLISAGVITTVVALTEDNRNNLVGGGINGEEQGNKNLPPFNKSNEENSNIGGFEADPNVNRPNIGGMQGQEQNVSDNIIYANQNDDFLTHKTYNEKTANQLNQLVNTGKAPSGLGRIDTGKVKGEQLHIVVTDSNGKKHALNVDGTWKHGGTELTNKQKDWLIDNGFKIQ